MQPKNLEKRFKKAREAYHAGLIMLFISLFVESYHYLVFDGSELVADWTFSFMLGWANSIQLPANSFFFPGQLSFPFALNVVFIALIVVSAYIVHAKSMEAALEEQKPYGMILALVPIVSLIYLVLFPSNYLSSRSLYFPVLLHQQGTLIRIYTISYGYFLLMGGFLLTFPYGAFYHATLLKFEKERQSSEFSVEEQLELEAEEMIAVQHAEIRLKTEGM